MNSIYFLMKKTFYGRPLLPTKNQINIRRDKAFFQELQQSQLNGFKYRVSKETIHIYCLVWKKKRK